MPFTPEELQNFFGDVADDARKIDEDRIAFINQTGTCLDNYKAWLDAAKATHSARQTELGAAIYLSLIHI